MSDEKKLETLLETARTVSPPLPSTSLIERVLADAAAQSPTYVAVSPPPARSGFFQRLCAPIGGYGGAFALVCFTATGVVAGAGYSDTLNSIPVLDDVLSAFIDTTDTATPFETLSLLMTES